MNFKSLLLLFLNLWISQIKAQVYTSYFIGNSTDLEVQPKGGVCLMGGGSENDNAMRWFLEQANGGDIVVLRTSGSDGYNDYFFSELGVNVNSVETIVCNNALSGSEEYIISRISKAEGLWFAGGNQGLYLSYWRNSEVLQTIQNRIDDGMIVGGISAGMAILGEHYFSAENGTITSNEALLQPFHPNLTLGSSDFLDIPFLENTITDTHYNNPDRRGRHSVFLSRLINENPLVKGIACDEHTAVCIDTNGIAKIFGDYPNFNDYAWFIRPNCSIANNSPEILSENSALTWSQNQEAISVYKVPANGNNTFNLNDWQTGIGGTWQFWSINNGQFESIEAQPINCGLSVSTNQTTSLNVIWDDEQTFHFNTTIDKLQIFNSLGQKVPYSNEENERFKLKKMGDFYFFQIEIEGKIEVLKVTHVF